jgi:penicillin G amidase
MVRTRTSHVRSRSFAACLCFCVATGCTPRTGPGVSTAVPDTLVHVAGLSAPVRIVTDAAGIPHVRAESLDDLYFAWGYVTARERLWQIAHNRAAARGERWRWMGNDVLRSDGAAQLMDFASYADRLWAREKADPNVGPPLERYTAGINAWIERCEKGDAAWPVEFQELHARPERWKPEDTVLLLWSLGVLLDLDLSELGERNEVARLGKAGAAERRRYESDVRFTTIPDSAGRRQWGIPPAAITLAAAPAPTPREARHARETIAALRQAFGRRDPDGRASNVFAAGAGRTAGGAPVLGNDVHLGLTFPAALMVIHVTVPGVVDAAGAFPPGLPAIVSGRNRDCAWGITALSADMLDVYADSISADGRSVRGPDGAWSPVRVEPFRMRYRFAGIPFPPFGQSRRYGPHGPILVWSRKAGIAWGLRWSALTDHISLRRTIGIERSASAAELESRWQTLVTPGINVIAADRSGDVRYRAVGALPHRTHDPGRGPARGDGSDEWLGIVPPDSMPGWSPPRGGWVVNANNLPIGDAYPVPLARYDWSPDRALRIDQCLREARGFDAAQAVGIQADVRSLRAARFLPLMLACADSLEDRLTPSMRVALDTLRAWNFEADRRQTAPLVFWSWYGELERGAGLQGLPGRLRAALAGESPESIVPPDSAAPRRAALVAVDALRAALETLEQRQGPDQAEWRYGLSHRARFAHPLGERPGIRPLLPDSIAIDGDGGTVSVGRARLPWSGDVTHAPVFRDVVDLSVPDRAWVMVTPGNSGRLRGPHARDLLERWANHQPVELRMNWQEIMQAGSTDTTRLVPVR